MAIDALKKQGGNKLVNEYFDLSKFLKGLKELNTGHGYKSLGEEPSDEDVWAVKGYQDCLDDVINIFKECLLIEETEE